MIIEIYIYRTKLFVRKFLRKLGFKRRYLFIGSRLDERICQKMFDDLSVITRKLIISKSCKTAQAPIPVFLHIPKTAGTSIGNLFETNISRNDWYNTIERPEDGYETDYFRCGVNNPDLKMVQGHFDIRLHDVFERPYKSFTFLRDPIERTVSFYYYLLQNPSEDLMPKTTLTLEQVFSSKYAHLFENHQVRYLCGKPTKPLTQQDLQLAKENLDKEFAWVGTVETIQEDIIKLGEIFNFNTGHLQALNKGKSRPLIEDLSVETRELIQQNNTLDIELYNHVLAKREA